MTNPNDPVIPMPATHVGTTGLSKREAIAMHVLAGLLANPNRDTTRSFPHDAVVIADALIAALNEKGEE